MNYRSAVLHGEATLVDDPAEKLYAMELITEGIFRGRWSETRTPTATELTSTGILRVRVTSASAKVSRGPPGDGKADLEDEELVERGWTGVVPMWTVLGVPVTVGAGKGALPAEMGVEVEERNERSRREAVEAVKE